MPCDVRLRRLPANTCASRFGGASAAAAAAAAIAAVAAASTPTAAARSTTRHPDAPGTALGVTTATAVIPIASFSTTTAATLAAVAASGVTRSLTRGFRDANHSTASSFAATGRVLTAAAAYVCGLASSKLPRV